MRLGLLSHNFKSVRLSREMSARALKVFPLQPRRESLLRDMKSRGTDISEVPTLGSGPCFLWALIRDNSSGSFLS